MTLLCTLMPEAASYKQCTPQDLRFAVVGFGKMGILHSGILNLLKLGSVRAIVDKSRLLVFGASKLIKNTRFYRDIDEMLKEENPSVVYVTTPAQSHYGIVSRLLETYVKNIFVEKPPTSNSKELASLVDKMGSNQTVMVGFQKRFSLPFRHAKTLISEKVIGDVEKVFAYIKSGDIVAPTARFDPLGRGVLMDLGIHLIDLLQWIFNANIVESCRCKRIYTGVDDFFEAKLRTDDDVEVGVEVTWCSPEHRLPETYIEVHASKGLLRVTEDYVKVESVEKHPMLKDGTKLEMYRPDYYRGIPRVNLADPEYTLENMSFLCSLHSGNEPLTSLRNIAGTVELIDELYGKACVLR
jgi:predicted dehydrogenase